MTSAYSKARAVTRAWDILRRGLWPGLGNSKARAVARAWAKARAVAGLGIF